MDYRSNDLPPGYDPRRFCDTIEFTKTAFAAIGRNLGISATAIAAMWNELEAAMVASCIAAEEAARQYQDALLYESTFDGDYFSESGRVYDAMQESEDNPAAVKIPFKGLKNRERKDHIYKSNNVNCRSSVFPRGRTGVRPNYRSRRC